ncbi:MAG: hypothetical protein E7235_03715 [Lachnospiraceae bacterium]|nr:hypothetical protein [Lachnospiraceae bacterium]
MKIKWYWPAKMLGLVKDVSAEYNDGSTYTQVSAKTGDVFFYFHIAVPFVLFVLGFIIAFLNAGKAKEKFLRKAFNIIIIIMLIYAVLLTVGVAPYFEFYPQGGGFIDLTVFENITRGIYMAITAFSLWLGKTVGFRLNKER